jgi:phosphoesterase RecJ-like protein
MFSDDKIGRLRELAEGAPQNVVIASHTNPDGDAIGSSLAWATVLRRRGHNVTCVVPNRYPVFLEWLSGINELKINKLHPAEVAAAVAAADSIFCLDFNQVHRLDGIGELIARNEGATKILIDHHLDPPHDWDIELSDPTCSSTSFLIYELIERLGMQDVIDLPMAEQLYVGIMTDTGNFSHSNLSAELFRAVATLVERGLDIPKVNRLIYNSFSADRLRLMGYALSRMETVGADPHRVAWMTLTEAELRRFNFRLGDSEGFVNYPLSIRDMAISAMFIETRNFIRVSLRSRPDVDVSEFARRYFDGGGHKNASGGKSFDNMAVTIERFKKAVGEFFDPPTDTRD